MRTPRPIVGVISDRRTLGHHAFQVQGEKYLTAIVVGAGGYPVGLPVIGSSLDDQFNALEILSSLDGLLLTGSPSNVEPRRYGNQVSRPGTLHDPERDHGAFGLIASAIQQGIPLLAICRGFQELNVAFGGTLHQEVDQLPGYLAHKTADTESLQVMYGPLHEVRFTPGGLLSRSTGREGAWVNSVHNQGVDRLGKGLAVEAVAPDGLIEAITVPDAQGFVLGLQWHPEWAMRENETSLAIFQSFGSACQSYRG